MADTFFSLDGKKIWVAGETGLVGRSLLDVLKRRNCEILHAPHSELDLTRADDTLDWLQANKPDAIFMAAARVGGIGANSHYPADFIHDNIAIAQSVIHGAYKANVGKLLFLGSSCIYPKMAKMPIAEEALMTGALEPTNEWYAIAKIAGLKLCQAYRKQYGCNFIAAMPTNLYGPYDRFDAEGSHVIPAMICKFDVAKRNSEPVVDLWGTGTPLREFLYAADLANALCVLMEQYNGEGPVNIGSGEEINIHDLACMIADVTGYKGVIHFNPEKPDGTPRKFLDSSKIGALGWAPETHLRQGLEQTYQWYLEEEATGVSNDKKSAQLDVATIPIWERHG